MRCENGYIRLSSVDDVNCCEERPRHNADEQGFI